MKPDSERALTALMSIDADCRTAMSSEFFFSSQKRGHENESNAQRQRLLSLCGAVSGDSARDRNWWNRLSRAEKIRYGTVRHAMVRCAECGVLVEEHSRANHIVRCHPALLDRIIARTFKP